MKHTLAGRLITAKAPGRVIVTRRRNGRYAITMDYRGFHALKTMLEFRAGYGVTERQETAAASAAGRKVCLALRHFPV